MKVGAQTSLECVTQITDASIIVDGDIRDHSVEIVFTWIRALIDACATNAHGHESRIRTQ
jgi:hypothetical protein